MVDEAAISAAKAALRRQLRPTRDAIAADTRATRSRLLCARAWEVIAPALGPNPRIATYAPIGSEVRVDLLRTEAPPEPAVQWAYPRVNGPSLSFHLGEPTAPGPWNIAQPAPDAPMIAPGDLDVVIVPGLGFDLHGHRLGYGAGYYDRALALAATNTLLIAVCFREQVIPMIPTTHRDHPMHVLVTEDADGVAVAHTFGAVL